MSRDHLLAKRFEIRQELGQGGMGVVYRAWDAALGKEVALKRVRELGPRDAQRLKSEFRARRALQHKNLVQLFELRTERGECFFTMELVEGTDLRSWVLYGPGGAPPEPHPSPARTAPTVEDRSLDPREVEEGHVVRPQLDAAGVARLRAALIQLCLGLSVLHEAGIVHRDVKPANVRVTPDGRVVLLDFGLAASPEAWSNVIVAGTPRYMAPEQARGEITTSAADLYAVGGVLYELIAGHPPFGGSADWLQFQKADDARPEPIPVGSADDHLATLAMALLEPAPAARPDTRSVLARLAGARGLPSIAPTFGLPVSDRFFGRATELRTLEAALTRAATEGAPVAVLVEGPSGIGKTTLARWFLEDAKRRVPELLVLASQCHPQESVPFKALDAAIDALVDHATMLSDRGSFDIGPFDPGSARAAVRLFPVLENVEVLAQEGSPCREEPDENELRAQGVELLRDLFEQLSKRGPLVLWIDDVQWDDADSSALLETMLRPRGAPPLLLLLGMRSGSRGSEIVARFSAPLSPVALERIRLGPMTEGEVAELAATFLDGADNRIPDVVSQSEGNAFLACELARYVATAPPHRVAAFAERGLDVQGLVAARLRDLGREERAILDVAALAVRPLPVDWALEAACLAPDARTLVLGLRDGFLLRHDTATHEEIAPYHDKIAEATQLLLSDEERATIHRRLAETFERHDPDDAVALCHHWEGANEGERAAAQALVAAESAAASLAFGRAAAFYDKALALAPKDADRAVLIERAAHAYANHGQAREAARRYLDASRSLGDDVRYHRVRTLKLLAAEQYVKSGYVREGFQVMRSVLEAVDVPVPKSPARAALDALHRRARFLVRRIDVGAVGGRSIPDAERARLEVLWTASTSMSMVNVTLSDYFRTRHLERVLEVGDRSSIARAFAYEVALEAHVGGPLLEWHARRLLRHAGALVEKTGDPYDRAWLALGVANQAFCAGRFRDAVAACESAEQTFRTQCHGVTWEITTVSAFLLMSLSMLGDLEKLRGAAERLALEAENHGDLFGIADAYGGDCMLAWWSKGAGEVALGRAKDASERQGSGAERWPEKNYRRGQMTELVATIHLRLLADDPWPAWEMLLAHWEGLGSAMIPRLQFYRSWIRSARARTALTAADHVPRGGARSGWTRERLLADVEKTHAEMKRDRRPFGPPWAALVEGALSHARGDEAGARRALESAAAGFDRADMALYREVARYHLGGQRRAQAESWLSAQGVADPRALAFALAPGYGRGSRARA